MILEVSHLAFGFPGGAMKLEDVCLEAAPHQLLCLLGPNGAGKTTLLRCMLGLLRPDAGRVALAGADIRTLARRALARAMAYVPQRSSVPFPFRVADLVLMGRTPHLGTLELPGPADAALAVQALERLGILDLKTRMFDALSGGERQMVLIARALCQEARILVLDEPTASLDYGNQIRILRVLSELRADGHAIVMSTHDPNHALLAATRVALLKGGRIQALGAPAEVITEQSLGSLYGARIRILAGRDPERTLSACVPLL
ncbi:MAG: ABC transporter ATP-binding protein [Holophaga sp.]|nr:ABC transporter ATP-binding protein [Holophaga sp.]